VVVPLAMVVPDPPVVVVPDPVVVLVPVPVPSPGSVVVAIEPFVGTVVAEPAAVVVADVLGWLLLQADTARATATATGTAWRKKGRVALVIGS
jgi:hypothetical protein